MNPCLRERKTAVWGVSRVVLSHGRRSRTKHLIRRRLAWTDLSPLDSHTWLNDSYEPATVNPFPTGTETPRSVCGPPIATKTRLTPEYGLRPCAASILS